MTTIASAGGFSSSVSSASLKLLPPARTRITRLPPNKPMVRASSIRRPGSAAMVSPSSGTTANGSAPGAAACTMASARSRTRPRSGPYIRITGRFRSGSARKASTSLARSATTAMRPLGAGEEEGGEARADLLGRHLGGAVLGVADSADPGEALLAAVDGDAGERLFGKHDLLVGDVLHPVGHVERNGLGRGAADGEVDHRIERAGGDGHRNAIGRANRVALAAGQLEDQVVAHFLGDAAVDGGHLDIAHGVADARSTGQGAITVEGLKTAADRGREQRHGG